jgi:hypothetical protein
MLVKSRSSDAGAIVTKAADHRNGIAMRWMKGVAAESSAYPGEVDPGSPTRICANK